MLILKNIVTYLTTELFFENLSFISIECLQGVVSFIALSLIKFDKHHDVTGFPYDCCAIIKVLKNM